jgi:hypothetical protein
VTNHVVLFIVMHPAGLNAAGKLPPQLSEFLKFRNVNFDTHGIPTSAEAAEWMLLFYEELLPCCVGPKVWCPAAFVKDTISAGGIVTISDEAYVALCCDNYEPKWLHNAANGKYTNNRKGNHLYGGWTNAGLTKFNELYDNVERSRNSEGGRKAELYFRSEMMASHGPTGSNKRSANKALAIRTRSEWAIVDNAEIGFTRGGARSHPPMGVAIDRRMGVEGLALSTGDDSFRYASARTQVTPGTHTPL